MKVTTVLKPAMLFAAGTVATGAHAATTIDMTYTSGSFPFGPTDITIGNNATPQYSFKTGPSSPTEFEHVISGLDGARITSDGRAAPFFPTANDPALGDFAVTGGGVKNPDQLTTAALRAADDKYYGLRFEINGVAQTGWARVNLEGTEINQISYQAIAAVPEPATWAMMIAGFGGVGVALRRRRRRQPLAVAA